MYLPTLTTPAPLTFCVCKFEIRISFRLQIFLTVRACCEFSAPLLVCIDLYFAFMLERYFRLDILTRGWLCLLVTPLGLGLEPWSSPARRTTYPPAEPNDGCVGPEGHPTPTPRPPVRTFSASENALRNDAGPQGQLRARARARPREVGRRGSEAPGVSATGHQVRSKASDLAHSSAPAAGTRLSRQPTPRPPQGPAHFSELRPQNRWAGPEAPP